MALTRSRDPLVWIDCEMTGLNPATDSIMSIACFISDADLTLLEPDGFEAVIHHSKERLDQMDKWCTRTHGDSGLTAACIASNTTASEAAEGLLVYVQRFVPEKGRALLAGNSVHADKSFLVKEPWDRMIGHLHYRILDVSAIKEGIRRWTNEEVLKRSPSKRNMHTAREDVLESIQEARFYMELFSRMS